MSECKGLQRGSLNLLLFPNKSLVIFAYSLVGVVRSHETPQKLWSPDRMKSPVKKGMKEAGMMIP